MAAQNGGTSAGDSGGPNAESKNGATGSPARRALVVGINDYQDPRNNLNSCIADAQAFAKLLRDGYGFTEIRELHDGDATLSQVRAGLDWLFAGATANDRLVYFQSSHGFQLTEGDQVKEVLVVRGESTDPKPYAFLEDDELSSRTQELPPGILTVTLDACFSGGMNKVLLTDDVIGLVRAKVWMPGAADVVTKQFSPGELSFKLFGRAPIRSSSDLSQFWNLPADDRKDFVAAKDLADSSGAVVVNGLLMAACQANETAAAGTSRTNNLSAFTYALLGAIDRLGEQSPAQPLCDDATRVLQNLHMFQTPVVDVPPQPSDMASRSFINADVITKEFIPVDHSIDDIYARIGAAVARSLAQH